MPIRFQTDPDALRQLDALAHRYSCLPHEVLQLDPLELGIALAAFGARCQALARAGDDAMVFAVMEV